MPADDAYLVYLHSLSCPQTEHCIGSHAEPQGGTQAGGGGEGSAS